MIGGVKRITFAQYSDYEGGKCYFTAVSQIRILEIDHIQSMTSGWVEAREREQSDLVITASVCIVL